jgi:hypothetical protein
MKRIIELIEAGNTIRDSCLASGISDTTYRVWLKQGTKFPKTIYGEFSRGIERATAIAITKNMDIIQKASLKSWQAAAWWLERRHPDDFGLQTRTKQEITGKDGGPIVTKREIPCYTTEELKEVLTIEADVDAKKKKRKISDESGEDGDPKYTT